jgi:hypothetical protein
VTHKILVYNSKNFVYDFTLLGRCQHPQRFTTRASKLLSSRMLDDLMSWWIIRGWPGKVK